MCSGNKSATDPKALMLNKVLLFLTNAFKGVQENLYLHDSYIFKFEFMNYLFANLLVA